MRFALLISLLFASGLGFAQSSTNKGVLVAAKEYIEQQKPLSALFVLESFLAEPQLAEAEVVTIALAANQAGVLNMQQGFVAKARNYFLKAKQASKNLDKPDFKSVLSFNLGLLAWLDQRLDAASRYFVSSEKLLTKQAKNFELLNWEALLAFDPAEKYAPVFFAQMFLLDLPLEEDSTTSYQTKRVLMEYVLAEKGLENLFESVMESISKAPNEKISLFIQLIKMLEDLPRNSLFNINYKLKVDELLREWERLKVSRDDAYQADLLTRNHLSHTALNRQYEEQIEFIERGRYLLWLILFVALFSLSVFWIRRTLQAQSLIAIIKTKENAQSRLARYDALTQLLNRKVADEIVETELKKLDQKSPFLTLVLADVDEFSRINQNYGHEIGDYILVAVAKKLSDNLRAQDLVARWSGKQFLLYLPDTDSKGVQTVCEKLRSSVESELISVEYDYLKVTLTFAVISVHYSDTLSDISKQFEDVLFQGKQTGGNQVVISQD